MDFVQTIHQSVMMPTFATHSTLKMSKFAHILCLHIQINATVSISWINEVSIYWPLSLRSLSMIRVYDFSKSPKNPQTFDMGKYLKSKHTPEKIQYKWKWDHRMAAAIQLNCNVTDKYDAEYIWLNKRFTIHFCSIFNSSLWYSNVFLFCFESKILLRFNKKKIVRKD